MDPQTDERTSVPEEPEEPELQQQQQLEAKVEPPLRRKPSRKVRRCRSAHLSTVVTDLDRMHFNPKEENKDKIR